MRALGDRVFADWVWGSFALYAGWLLLVVVACLVYAGVGNIADALVSEELRFATRLSLLTATISTLLSLLIGIPSAYALTHLRGRLKTVVDTFLDLTLVLPPVAIGVALLVFFSQFPVPNRSLDKWLQQIGMPVVFEVPA
ncbi:MAG: hypothetical protein RRB12_13085, partial [Armatimonadota bacterium]|nr:hypothetical protein [Armatimonadota bacterium]